MKRTIVYSIVGTLLVVVLVPMLVIASGAINMAASNEPSALEESIAKFAVRRSMAVRVPGQTSALVNDPGAIDSGLEHYKSMCVQCHGGPGVKPEEFSEGLNPPAPMLETAGTNFSNGELFWIVKHGIRMTGMPGFGKTHSDEDVWKIVAAVKHLSDLLPEQKEKLAEGRAPSAHSHGSGEVPTGHLDDEAEHHHEGEAAVNE